MKRILLLLLLLFPMFVQAQTSEPPVTFKIRKTGSIVDTVRNYWTDSVAKRYVDSAVASGGGGCISTCTLTGSVVIDGDGLNELTFTHLSQFTLNVRSALSLVAANDTIISSAGGVTTVASGSVNAVFDKSAGTAAFNATNGLYVKPTSNNTTSNFISLWDYSEMAEILGFYNGQYMPYIYQSGKAPNYYGSWAIGDGNLLGSNLGDTAYAVLYLGNKTTGHYNHVRQDTFLAADVTTRLPRTAGRLANESFVPVMGHTDIASPLVATSFAITIASGYTDCVANSATPSVIVTTGCSISGTTMTITCAAASVGGASITLSYVYH